jgi:hypothetical protein
LFGKNVCNQHKTLFWLIINVSFLSDPSFSGWICELPHHDIPMVKVGMQLFVRVFFLFLQKYFCARPVICILHRQRNLATGYDWNRRVWKAYATLKTYSVGILKFAFPQAYDILFSFIIRWWLINDSLNLPTRKALYVA